MQGEPDYDADRRARLDYLRSITPTPKKKRAGLRWTIIIVLLLALIGGGTYYWMYVNKKTTTTTKTTTTQKTTTTKTKPTTVATTHYDSSNFNLGFDYPQKWTVTDVAGSGQLTISSTPMQLKDVNGKTYTGQIVVEFRNKQSQLTEFAKGNAVAVRTSDKISYSKPSSVQRADTYISFLNYASSTSSTSLDAVYVTGDYGYQTGQAVPMNDVVNGDPLITVSFMSCTKSTCAGDKTASNVQPSIWGDTSFSTPILTLLKSLVING